MSWQQYHLREILELKYGKSLPERERELGDIPVYGSGGIGGFHNVELVKGPGVIVGRKGTVGSVFFEKSNYFPIDTTYYVEVAPKKIQLKFSYYLLKHLPLSSLNTDAAVPGLNRERALSLRVNIPSIDTQERISSFLENYDNLIDNNHRRIELLEESARLLYREWFVHLRFPGHEHLEVRDGVPQGWFREPLEAICIPKDGIQTGPFGSQLHQSDYTDDGIPVVMPKDIATRRVSLQSIARIPESLANQLGRHRMQIGDTVYGRRGDIGRRAFIGPRQDGYFCGTGCLRFRPDPAIVNPRYLFDQLGAPDTEGCIINRAKGSTMPNLSAGALKTVPILLPPKRIQDSYAEAVEPTNSLIETLAEQNQKLAQARDLLLPRLMNGEITV